MDAYIVRYFECTYDHSSLAFECFADDAEHAAEQCENAYPHCIIADVERA